MSDFRNVQELGDITGGIWGDPTPCKLISKLPLNRYRLNVYRIKDPLAQDDIDRH